MLRGLQPSFNPFDPIQDTERGIGGWLAILGPGFNPFDPIQDTERSGTPQAALASALVSTHSIRYRILKAVQAGEAERSHARFQPIRSDTGY